MARVSFSLRSTSVDRGSYLGGPPAVPPPPSLLGEAVVWYDAAQSSAGVTPNLGTGGSALNAVDGTSAPKLLPHAGTNYVYLPGVAGNYLSVSDAETPGITDQLEFVVQVALDDWTPTAAQTLLGKGTDPDDFSYSFNIGTDGRPTLSLSADGTTASIVTFTSPSPVSFTDGDTGWVKVVWTNSGDGTCAFYESTDNVAWSLLGQSVTVGLGGLTVFNSTSALNIGAWGNGTSNPLAGSVYRVLLRKQVGLAADFDFAPEFDLVSASATTITTSQNSLTVTPHFTTSGRKTALVVRPVWLFGTDTFLTVPDNGLLDFVNNDTSSVMIVYRERGVSPSNARLLSKATGDTSVTGVGWEVLNNGTLEGANYFAVGDGSASSDTSATLTPSLDYGNLGTWMFLRDAADIWFNLGGSASAKTTDLTADLSNAIDLHIGRSSYAASGYRDMELAAVAVWDRVLTADEVQGLDDYYQATEGLGRVDFDYMLRADGLLLAPEGSFDGSLDFGEGNVLDGVFVGTGGGGSVGGGGTDTAVATQSGSYFAAGSHCYGEVKLEWGVESLPRTALSPPLGLTPVPTGTVLVYSAEGEPQTISSGDVLAEGSAIFRYSHEGLPEGRWAYYSLFVKLQTSDGAEFYERGASIAVLVPKNYGSSEQLWRRIPEFYRIQDTAMGSASYSACIGVSENFGKVGPLFKYLSIVGFDMDRMRTILDYTMASHDADTAHTEVLDALAEQMGAILRSSDLGPARLRRLMGDLGEYRRSKGTASAVSFLGSAIAGGDVKVNKDTGSITVYSQRTNYITDPKDATGLVTHRPAGNVEIDTPEEFSSTAYAAHTGTYTVSGTAFTPTGTGASVGVECVMIRIDSDVTVSAGETLCFSVHSNIGTDAIKWVRAYVPSAGGASAGISRTALKADGSRAFEVVVDTPDPDTPVTCGVEFLVDLGELMGEGGTTPGSFVLERLLLEKGFLGSYFDGDTVRGGWLVDTSSISDYRWSGGAYLSPSIYAEEYVRTNGVLDSVLTESALPINVAPYFSIAKYNGVSGVD